MINKLLPILLLITCFQTIKAQVPLACPSDTEPPADACTTACIYCNFNGVTSTTQGYGANPVVNFCGTIENEQWLGFIAGATNVTFVASPITCNTGDGVQIALYSGCNSNPIECTNGGGGAIPVSFLANNLTIGQDYFLLIDGYAGDQCSFNISVSPENGVSPQPLAPISGSINGPTNLCPGATAVYSIPSNVTGPSGYQWDAPAGATINGEPAPFVVPAGAGATQVTIVFGNDGGQVCVRPFNACEQGAELCKNVNVSPLAPTILPRKYVCDEDVPYTTPWGESVSASGTYDATFVSWLGCDSMVVQEVVVNPAIFTELPPRVICKGQKVTVCGVDYTTSGDINAVCQSFLGCDSLVAFSLTVFDPVANIIGSGSVTCASPNLVLNSSPAANGVKTWKTLSGTVLATGNSYTVTSPGTYVLQVTAASGSLTCSALDTIVVTGNTSAPTASATGGTIGCTTTQVQLNGGSSATGSTFVWAGPSGYSSNMEDPIVTQIGTYTVTVTNTSNGCSATATTSVDGNITPPQATATGGSISCTTASLLLNVTSSNTPNATFSWSGPNGFTATISNPSATTAGTYTVTVTNPTNSCTATATATVASNSTPPMATAAGGAISCSTQNVSLNGGSSAAGSSFAWTGPGGFTSSNEDPAVLLPGDYNLTVTATNGCTATATATVTGNTTPPNASATGGTLSCANNTVILNGNSTTSNVSYSWAGPSGFTASQQNPPVTAAGTYTLTVTSNNQCTATTTATVVGDFTVPNASATGGTISCAASSIAISGNSTTTGVGYEWNGPGNFSSTQQNVNVNTVGTYTLIVRGANGCTATATATVTPDANVPNASASGGTINCLVSSITISGGSTTAGTTFAWTGPGGFTSTNASTTVTTPGNYILTVSNPTNGCSAQATAVVDIENMPPQSSAVGGALSCSSPSLVISANSTTSGVTYAWSGPNSFTSAQQNPSVNGAGTYTVTVTGTNGCTSTTSAVVTADNNIPVPTTMGATLTCTAASVNLASSANISVTYAWSGPNNFTSNQQNPSVSEAGDYVVTVTAQNGCTATATATVASNTTPPGAAANGGTYGCASPTVTLEAISASTGSIFNWSGPNNYSSTSQNPTVSTAGIYTVTVTGSNGCTSSSTAQVTSNNTPPTIGIANAAPLTCTNDTITINSTITTGIPVLQSVVWTGPNGFTSTLEDPRVTVAGTYNVVATSDNGCTSTASITINQDNATPNASAVGSTLTCIITSVPIIGTSTSMGATFAWTGPGGFTSNIANPMVMESGTYNLVVTGSNGCTQSATAEVTLDGNFPDASADASFLVLDCTNTSTTLNGNSTTSGVTYSWTGPGGLNAATAIVPNVSNTGTFTFVVTAPNGCETTRSVSITEDVVSPDAMAMGDTLNCITGNVTLLGSSTNTGVTYSWSGPNNFSSNLPNPSATVPGSYILEVTATNGCTQTATAIVAENTDAPVVTLTGGGLLTCTEMSVDISANIQTAGATGSWTGPSGFSSNNPNITVSVPGVYKFTATAVNNCKSEPTLTVDQNIDPPGATAAGGETTCTDPTVQIGLTTVSNTVSYSWTGPGGFSSTLKSPEATEPGQYSVTVTDNTNGCQSTGTATITADVNLPTVTVSGELLTCTNDDFLVNTVSSPGNLEYFWLGPNGFTSDIAEPNISVAGNYQVTVTAANGCSTTASLVVVEDKVFPDVVTEGDTLTCATPTGTISGQSSTVGATYSWTGPGGFTSNLPNPTVTQTGVYTLVVMSANGCTSSETAEVSPDAGIPQVSALGGELDCINNEVQITSTANNPNLTWIWTGPNGFTSDNQNPVATEPGNYVVTVTAANGCSSTASVVISSNTNGPSVNVQSAAQLSCTLTQVPLNAVVLQAGSYTYQWTSATGVIVSGENTASPIVSQAGAYSVVVTNIDNGCTSERSVNVLVDPNTPSNAIIQKQDITCYGETNGSIVIDSVVGGRKPFLYSLNNQPFSATYSFSSLPPGQNTIQIQDANGCEWQTTLTINEPEELTVFLGRDTSIRLGESILVNLYNFVSDPFRIVRTDITPVEFDSVLCDSCNHYIKPLQTLTYKVTVYDSNGCKASDDRMVIVDKTRYVYIPNIIDPNSSGNAVFTVFGGSGVEIVKSFKVFDRWGEQVHEFSNFMPGDLASGWNGKIRGKSATPAVFVYFAEVKFIDGETIIYKGDVMVLNK